jgi:small GTP-binding protein
VSEYLKTISTGIKVVDDLFQGGIRRGDSLLLRAHPFLDVNPLAMQISYQRLVEGDSVLYYVNNKSPSAVIEESEILGFDFLKYRSSGDLCFIDGFSGLFGLESEEKYFVDLPNDPVSVSEVVSNALTDNSELGKFLFVVDSLNTVLDQCGSVILREVDIWCKYVTVFDGVSCYIFSEWGYPEETLEQIDVLFPSIIDLKPIERIVASQVITVSKNLGLPVDTLRIPVKVIKPGGIRGYIPKILVTGPFQAGKTTFVHALSEQAVSVQRMGTTVALDFGHVFQRGFAIDLFGTVGQNRFDPILNMLGSESLGVVLIVDSTNPREFPRAKEMLRKAGVHGLPYVVAANKQDLPGALTVDRIRELMQVPDDVPIIGTVASEKKGVIGVLDVLLDIILDV